jgi:hypothetical protein
MLHLNTYIFLAINIILALMCENTFAASHKPKDKYLEGFYYDRQGNKIEGLISKDDLNFQFFYFKKQLGDSAERIDASQCDSLSVDNRTFHAITDVSIKAIVWGTHMDRAFAELVTDGPVQLYCIRFQPGKVGYMHYVAIASNFTGGAAGQVVGAMAGRQNVNYFVRRRKEDAYMRVDKKTFTQEMSEYLKDDPSVVQKIMQNQDYSINNIELVIKEYDQDKCVAL